MNSNETNEPESPNEPPEEAINEVGPYQIALIRDLEHNRLFYESLMTRDIQEKNGVPQERMERVFDPNKYEEDKDKLDKATAKGIVKYQKNKIFF